MLRLWQAAVSPADAFYAQMSEGLFGAVRGAAELRLAETAGSEVRFNHGELTEGYYKKLMYYYNNALRLFSDNAAYLNPIANTKPGEILAGIRALILSRVQVYDARLQDGQDDAQHLNLPTEPAPGAARSEKSMIISRVVRGFSENFATVSYRCRYDLYNACFHSTRRRFIATAAPGGADTDDPNNQQTYNVSEIFQDALNVVREKGYPRFYELFEDSVSAAYPMLSEYYKHSASELIDAGLLNEHDLLRNLVTVQLAALERESVILPKPVLESISVIMNSLLMAYHALSQDLTEISDYVMIAAEASFDTDTGDYDSFVSYLDEAAAAGFRASAYVEARTSFSARFSAMREAFKRELAAATEAYLADLNREGSPAALAGERLRRVLTMTGEMAKVFDSIRNYYDGEPELLSSPGDLGRIAKGIAETVGIKAQSLEENAQNFSEAMAPYIEALTAEPGAEAQHGLPCGAGERTFAAMADELVLYQKADQRVMSVIRKYLAMRPDNDIYSDYFDALRRPADKRAAELENKIIKFYKEHLLYELSTFEEIQNYSLPRLRNSEDDNIRAFVAFLDSSGETLDGILKQNGIELIRPLPHDVFNGREHEVLMAEKDEGFKKGEIIKLMNSGYKQGNQVLLRANVIASR
ncbi:MAG: nucleotide exchange factor GrpE [Clostridiales bacterium]|jgi:molecular chaperone GrpE (heat shock protein)|nr:nucleotide exchange factor GrpE [Clostridiales bacterium]